MIGRNLPIWLRALNERDGRSEMERLGQPGGNLDIPMGGPPAGGVAPIAQPATGAQADEGRLAYDQLQELIGAIWRRGNLFTQPFVVGVVAVRLRPAEKRQYMFLQNQSAANQMAIGFGNPPDSPLAVPCNGIVIPVNLGFYEPLLIPQGEIWVIGSAAATAGVLIYSA